MKSQNIAISFSSLFLCLAFEKIVYAQEARSVRLHLEKSFAGFSYGSVEVGDAQSTSASLGLPGEGGNSWMSPSIQGLNLGAGIALARNFVVGMRLQSSLYRQERDDAEPVENAVSRVYVPDLTVLELNVLPYAELAFGESWLRPFALATVGGGVSFTKQGSETAPERRDRKFIAGLGAGLRAKPWKYASLDLTVLGAYELGRGHEDVLVRGPDHPSATTARRFSTKTNAFDVAAFLGLSIWI